MKIDRNQPAISIVNGRAYRNESLEPNGKHGVTADDQKRLLELHHERAGQRQAAEAFAFAQALKLGATFKGG